MCLVCLVCLVFVGCLVVLGSAWRDVMKEAGDAKRGEALTLSHLKEAESEGVREWKARKAEHEESPLAVLLRGGVLVEAARAPGVRAEARIDGVILARTERAQVVNQRVYFPLEDCSLNLLRDSKKRWR